MKYTYLVAITLGSFALMQCTTKPKAEILPDIASSAVASSEVKASSSSYVEIKEIKQVKDTGITLNALLNQITDPQNTIYFEYNSDLLSAEGQASCQKIAELLRLSIAQKVELNISGHADERGTEQFNMVLSENRAKVVKKYITDLGVNSSRISTTAFGKMKPAVEGNDESAWSKNRRDEFSVSVK
jgi:outer membrane protein OmpA-like peptidoglycan-associated protein